MPHTYFVMKREGQPDKVLVWDTRTLAIGRAKENDIVLPDNEISRKHALLKKEGKNCFVGDYQTGNGTFVNGQRIEGTAPKPLRSGDVVEIATLLRMEFYDGDEHPAKRGLKLEYASHLKTVGMLPGNANVNPNATLLGMADNLPDAEDDFVIERRSWDDKAGPPALLEDVLIEKKDKENKAPVDLDDDMGDLGFATSAKASAAPPPGDSQTQAQAGDPMARMRKLKVMLAEGLITQDEFEKKRAKILEEI
jgi:predicted component of type VI protein secretion system